MEPSRRVYPVSILLSVKRLLGVRSYAHHNYEQATKYIYLVYSEEKKLDAVSPSDP